MSDSENRKESRESAQELTHTVDSDGPKTPTGPGKTVTVGWAGSGRDAVDIPTTIGNVRIMEEVGRGGMGIVFRGWDEVLHRQVAIKFLLGVAADEGGLHFQRFFGGARAEAAVRHPNIVVVHTAGVVVKVPYLVMDHIDGPTLREITENTGGLPLAAAVKVMWDVAGAVAALHERDVIHRDLKPANVLFDQDGHLFVTDFGLASLRRRSDSPMATAGTPAYMAPETFEGKASPQSDVYAMGIMLFELLSGRLPFTGDLAALRDQHAHAPLPVAELADSIPASIVEVIERAAHKKEMFRYKRAEHFQRALRDCVATDELLHEGAADLRAIVFKLHEKEALERPTEKSEEPSTSTYFERLTEIADEKRATREQPHEPVCASPSESPLGNGGLRGVGAEASPVPHGDQPVEAGSIPGPPSAEPARVAALVVDVPCAKCDYNLRGLSAGGRCPECGEGIASSLRPDRLLFAEPSWLRHIMRGLTVLYASVAATPVLFLVGGTASFILSTGGMVAPALAGAVAGVVLIVGLVLGSFFATAAEPRRAGESSRWSSRRVARTLGILFPLLLAAVPVTASYSGVLAIISLGFMWAAFLGMIVTFLLYLASLADRIPMARLRTQARGLAIAVGVVQILGAGAALAAFGLEKAFPTFSWIMFVVLSICVLGSILSAGLFWGLIRLYRKAIKRVIAASVSLDTLFGDVPN